MNTDLINALADLQQVIDSMKDEADIAIRVALSQAAPVAASADSEATAWEAPAYRGIKRFTSDRLYRLYRPEVQAFYKPFKCANCLDTPQAAPVAAAPKLMTDAEFERIAALGTQLRYEGMRNSGAGPMNKSTLRICREVEAAVIAKQAPVQQAAPVAASEQALTDDRDSWREQASQRVADAVQFAKERDHYKALYEAPQAAPVGSTELKDAGYSMSNWCFNMAQRIGHTLDSDDIAALDKMRKRWDVALSQTPQALPKEMTK